MTIRELAGALVRILGQQEFKWLKQYAKSTPELHVMLNRRLAGEPLQYILGTQPFGPLDLIVRPPVLIPRPETEDWALRLARRLSSPSLSRTPQAQAPLKILDLCTGTGCIPLLLCHMCKSSSSSRSVRALGIDISSEAIALATENAERTKLNLQLNGKHGNDNDTEFDVSFIQADLLRDSFPRILKNLGSGFRPPVDVLTANPPYIPLHEYRSLPSSVKDYEDPRALLGDPDPDPDRPHSDQEPSHRSDNRERGRGLTFYHAIARLVRAEEGIVKRSGGLVVLEVGHDQAAEVVEIMTTEGGVRSTEVWKDPYGIERTVVCTT